MNKLKPEPATLSQSHCKVGKITPVNPIKLEEKDKGKMVPDNEKAKYPRMILQKTSNNKNFNIQTVNKKHQKILN